MATTPTLDCLPIFVAQERGMYAKNKANISLMAMMAQMDCQEALLNDKAQLIASDLMRGEKMRKEGKDVHYVTTTNIHWQLITNRLARITDLKQLGDKMVAMTRFSATDFLCRHVIDSVKPKNKVFSIQINDVNIRLKMLLNNEMDAMWLPEPQATEGRLDKHLVLYDTQRQGWQFGCLLTLAKTWNDATRKKQIEDFITVYNMACDSINSHGVTHYSDVIQKYCHVSDKTVKALPKTVFIHAHAPTDAQKSRAQAVNWND
ncbi:MAG: ABC transporter substrate-binding protein [Prevotella sp.]|nr:ABC transporter substrate-binding protein [Prevotella sp.]